MRWWEKVDKLRVAVYIFAGPIIAVITAIALIATSFLDTDSSCTDTVAILLICSFSFFIAFLIVLVVWLYQAIKIRSSGDVVEEPQGGKYRANDLGFWWSVISSGNRKSVFTICLPYITCVGLMIGALIGLALFMIISGFGCASAALIWISVAYAIITLLITIVTIIVAFVKRKILSFWLLRKAKKYPKLVPYG